jgi:hypothetical protein
VRKIAENILKKDTGKDLNASMPFGTGTILLIG